MHTVEDAQVTVVIPAHNEARVLPRTLASLRHGLSGDLARRLEVLVVCNGCTDDTAARARAADPHARVVEIPTPSKTAAVRTGNALASGCPRVHLDADVELSGSSLLALVRALDDGVLAAAPRRVLPRDGCSWTVRWYYDVWEALPQVRSGLFGRGVFALSEAGQARVDTLPELLSDDLAVSEAFDESERVIVDAATVVVRPPRTLRDLVRRRVRVVTGNVQADAVGARRSGSSTSLASLVRLGATRPSLLPRLPVFVGVAVLARLLSRPAVRAGDFTTWQRDESSRAA